VARNGDPRQLVAYDTAADTGNSRAVLDDPKAMLPVISPDRRSFAYLEASGARQRLMVALADGSGTHAVLDDSESSRCPVANRPAWSPDGKRLAVVCLPTKNAPSSGLYVVNRDGTDPTLVTSDRDPEGAPTWSGPDTIVFQSGNDRVAPPSSLWEVSADGGQPRRYGASHFPKSASRPDWSSENGVLFLLSDPGTNAGRVMYEKSRGVAADLAQETDAQFPAWGPDGNQAVWLSSHGAGFTLWYSSGPGATPRALKIDGSNATFGPPAWGSR
jgi:Tol biopolymer transport system component